MVRLSLFLSCIIIFSSCSFWQQKEEVNLSEAIKGDWLILYPDHELKTAEQRKRYGEAQDSIVSLFGLKTISFNDKASFLQTDSIFRPAGKWHFNPENNNLFIRDAGKGLDFFQANLISIKRDTMQIVENISLGGQTIKLTWFLKRITDKKNSLLFNPGENWWRKKIAGDTDTQLRKKIKAILAYYSLYYEMVSKESAYFSQSKVFLPFSYYQHAIGLKPFNAKSNFSQLFYNTQQAEQAYTILSEAMDNLKGETFPSGENFVIEYSKYMKQLAEVTGK